MLLKAHLTSQPRMSCSRSVTSPLWLSRSLRSFSLSVQFSHSVVSDSLWPLGLQHTRPPCPSPTPRACSTHVRLVSDDIQPSHPLSSPSSPVFNLSQHQDFFQMSQFFAIRWPKYWSFSFSISASNEYSGLISFRIDWFDLLAVQRTPKSLLHKHSLKASVL